MAIRRMGKSRNVMTEMQHIYRGFFQPLTKVKQKKQQKP